MKIKDCLSTDTKPYEGLDKDTLVHPYQAEDVKLKEDQAQLRADQEDIIE